MNSFASYYHALSFSQEGYEAYLTWLKSEAKGYAILDCACGTGYFSKLCAEAGFTVDAIDIDPDMIIYAKLYNVHDNVSYYCHTMLELSDFKQYDVITVFLDSLNYLNDLDQIKVFCEEAYTHLKPNGCLLFDVHQEKRLLEFEEEFIEEGYVMNIPYQWTIQTLDAHQLHHQFIFYEEELKKHSFTQTIFSLQDILEILESIDFKVDVKLGLDELSNDEKYYISARKGLLCTQL